MIKKLRRKFIIVAMISVFIVLALTMTIINVSNYVSIENSANEILKEVIKQGTDEPTPSSNGPNVKKRVDLREEHYFIVSFNNDGSINDTNDFHTFILSKEECNELATKVFNNELLGNKYGTLRFKKELKDDGLTYVGFVDIKEKLNNFYDFLITSVLISSGAYITLSIFIIVASKIAFRPNEEAYKKQKRFITNASHELKTPLTVISADMDIIEMDNGKSEWSDSIRDQIKRLTEMTNQLVLLSKLEEDDPNSFEFKEFSLSEICENAINAFSNNFKKENINFTSDISNKLIMNGNQKMIEELIYIFLDNSVKYTGGDNKVSSFNVNENKGKIEFKFVNSLNKDDEVDIKQMMERFYRSPSNKKEGSGVGLSIAQEIINLHKGTIKINKDNDMISFVILFTAF